MITIEDMVQRNTDLLLEMQEDIRKLLGKDSGIPDGWMTGAEAAEVLKVGYVHFMNFWKNKFPHKKVGRNVIFDKAAVMAYARDRKQNVNPVEYRQGAAV